MPLENNQIIDLSGFATLNDLADYAPADGIIIGEIKMYPFASAPSKHLLLQGEAVSRTTYPDLWALASGVAITETAWATDKGKFSVGDGSTTFRLPDLSEVVLVGYKSGSAEFGTLGKTYGEKVHALVSAENGPHVHTVAVKAATSGDGHLGVKGSNAVADWGGVTSVVESAGSGTAHNNIQPSVAVNFIIRALA